MTSKLKLLVATAVIPAVLLNAVPAMAAGTTQGTSIVNNITVDYQVGGQGQTQITNVNQPSSSNTFLVDRKILFTINEKATTGTTSVSPGQTGRITTFLLTNSSNDTLDFTVTPANITGGTAAHGGTDAFNIINPLICLDGVGAAADGACDVAATASITVNDLLADTNATILILGEIPATALNGQVANVSATATALNSTGTAITAATDATVNSATTVETVFADAAKTGNGGTSAARDGIDVATDDYTVGAAALTVFKTSRVVFDNLITAGASADPTNPKSVPGATVEYCISVANAVGSATATNLNIRDVIPANMTYVAGSIRVNATVTSPGASQTCAGGTAVSDATDADAGQFVVASERVEGTLSNLTGTAGSNTSALVFRATID
jgi:uncharacterized repeat protein (TIGR01451 family)